MRTQQQFLTEYRRTHSNPTNALVHTICVPIILFASFGMLWTVPVGMWLGLAGVYATWVNAADIVAVLAVAFYTTLSGKAGLYMTIILLACAAGTMALDDAGVHVLWLCAGLWIAAWLGQFYGHHVEGAKPAFLDDVVFLLIGPLFILDKYDLLGTHQPVAGSRGV